jgi:amidohydrolase
VALLRGGLPGITVAVRAGLDAVPIQEQADVPFKSLNPGVMHANGRDIDASVVLGTAFVLNALRDRLKGNVKFIFQPASEGGRDDEESGAALMIKEGTLENPTVGAVFGFRVWPEDVGRVFSAPGPLLASSDSFSITIKGRSAQGAQPQEGVDAIVLAAQIVTALQAIISRTVDPTEPALLTIGRIEGGAKADLIADRVRIEGIVRTLNETTRRKVQRQMEGTVKGLVNAFGGDYAFSYVQDVPPVVNHPELFGPMSATVGEALGEERVRPIKPQMMADDFAFFGQKVPSFYFLLGVKSPRLPATAPYSPAFNPDERSIATGIKILAHLVLDGLDQQSRLVSGSDAPIK